MLKITGRAAKSAWSLAFIPTIAVMLAVGAMAGCGGVGKSLGYGKQSPDEFAVVRNTPLTLPPDYSLRPPRPGAQRPQVETIRQKAKNTVFTRAVETDDSSSRLESEGEHALLRQADALETNPNIKREINEEFTIYVQEGEGFFEDLLFWQAKQPLGESIDAQEEAQRLNENAALGLPPNSGDTPVIERREQGIFEGIF